MFPVIWELNAKFIFGVSLSEPHISELNGESAQEQEDDVKEKKETDPDMLQRQQNKGGYGWENGKRGIVPGVLLKLLMKDKLRTSL